MRHSTHFLLDVFLNCRISVFKLCVTYCLGTVNKCNLHCVFLLWMMVWFGVEVEVCMRGFSSVLNILVIQPVFWSPKRQEIIAISLFRFTLKHYVCLHCDMTPESRNGPLLDNGKLKHVLGRCGFVETDFIRNALSMSTESTNNFHGYAQAKNIFHGYAKTL
jgi:hypothetical protein